MNEIVDLLRGLSAVPASVRAMVGRMPQPRYPVIDIHGHLDTAFGHGFRGASAARVLAALDRAGVAAFVDLDGGQGEHLSTVIARLQIPAPDRLAVFASPDLASFARDRSFGETEAERLVDSVRRGARGLKIWKSLGLHARDAGGRLVALDDSRLGPLWEAAAGLAIPVLVHVADPPAFFRPLDDRNERREELRRNPAWHYSPIRRSPTDAGFPSHGELIGQFERLVAGHPRTTFIGAHLASLGEDLGHLAELLGRHANLHVDIAARINELGRQPETARRLLEAFADRVLFGTDQGPDPRWYPVYIRFLESRDRSINYSIYAHPVQGSWRIDGLGLSDAALRHIYGENARRLIRFGRAG